MTKNKGKTTHQEYPANLTTCFRGTERPACLERMFAILLVVTLWACSGVGDLETSDKGSTVMYVDSLWLPSAIARGVPPQLNTCRESGAHFVRVNTYGQVFCWYTLDGNPPEGGTVVYGQGNLYIEYPANPHQDVMEDGAVESIFMAVRNYNGWYLQYTWAMDRCDRTETNILLSDESNPYDAVTCCTMECEEMCSSWGVESGRGNSGEQVCLVPTRNSGQCVGENTFFGRNRCELPCGTEYYLMPTDDWAYCNTLVENFTFTSDHVLDSLARYQGNGAFSCRFKVPNAGTVPGSRYNRNLSDCRNAGGFPVMVGSSSYCELIVARSSWTVDECEAIVKSYEDFLEFDGAYCVEPDPSVVAEMY